MNGFGAIIDWYTQLEGARDRHMSFNAQNLVLIYEEINASYRPHVLKLGFQTKLNGIVQVDIADFDHPQADLIVVQVAEKIESIHDACKTMIDQKCFKLSLGFKSWRYDEDKFCWYFRRREDAFVIKLSTLG